MTKIILKNAGFVSEDNGVAPQGAAFEELKRLVDLRLRVADRVSKLRAAMNSADAENGSYYMFD